MKIIYIFIITFCEFGLVVNKPIYLSNYAADVLSHYGHLPTELLDSNEYNINNDDIKGALAKFQKFSGMNATGTMDDDTIKMMRMPRCGVKDEEPFKKGFKRFLTNGGKGTILELTLNILNHPTHLKKDDVVDVITRAGKIWAKSINLIVGENDPKNNSMEKVDVNVSFADFDHGDSKPFDGPGNEIGHATPPKKNNPGEIHLDMDEKWSINSSYGISLYQVVAHELGHVLGVDHSTLSTSIMQRGYHYNETFQKNLSRDVIKVVQHFLGKKRKMTNKPDKKFKKQEIKCKKSPPQFFHSTDDKEFMWTDNIGKVIQEDIRNLTKENNEESILTYTYKQVETVLCSKNFNQF